MLLQSLEKHLNLPRRGIEAVVKLHQEGATVPFMARYRKDTTGGLDEVQIREIIAELERQEALNARRETIFKTLGERLTPELKARFLAADTATALEDLYLPYKPRRRTRAQKAREAGLEPLARALRYGHARSPLDLARSFTKEGLTPEGALQGARDIVAEGLAENATLRDIARDVLWHRGKLNAKAVKDAEDRRFEDYHDFSSALRSIPSHRFLALQRGEAAKALRLSIELDADVFLKRAGGYLQVGRSKRSSAWDEQLKTALADSWKRLLRPSIITEVFQTLKIRSDERAIAIFSKNVEDLLLAPPLGTRSVMAFDPGLRTGIKCVMLSHTGDLLDHWVLHSTRQPEAAKVLFLKKWRQHQPEAIAIGDGTGGREAQQAVREWLKGLDHEATPPLIVSVPETGASIYSASELAREEFPELDLTFRGAVSIGRRLQDPLAELVKIPPRSLGVGQYQHDVDQKALSQELTRRVESCVNRVGVELNTASVPLLAYVSGLSQKVAQNIVDHRQAQGAFVSRAALKKVKGLGPKTFEQAAGFLRIRQSKQVLDRTGVHPEQYDTVKRMVADLDCSLETLVSHPQRHRTQLEQLPLKRYASEEVGAFALQDIVAELQKPGRDPRDKFQMPTFAAHVQTLNDLKADMVLEGRVTNITAFGAFVDIGVHQDGLVHISQLAEGFVKDPQDVVRQGQTLKVKVLEVDQKRRRIQLSARL